MKKSRDTFKKYSNEVKNLQKIINKHEARKNELLKQGSKKKKENANQEEEVKKMQEEWEMEKQQLLKERDDIKAECNKL